MAWALLVVGASFAALTLHSLRPLRWPGTLTLGTWLASWLVMELPFHHLVVQIVVATALVLSGALGSWPGGVGLALCMVSWSGLLVHYALARRAAGRVEDALVSGLGPDYGAASAGAAGELPPRWWRLARVLPFRHANVDRTRNLLYHTANGRKLTLDVYRPASHPDKRPVLMYVHGGGWIIGNKAQQGLLTVNQLASQGWVCVSINYRLSPRATFPDHIIDVKRAIKWVRENIADYGGDANFLMLAGGSAGAHLAALASVTGNDLEYQRDFAEVDTRVQGCVAYYGVYDFTDRDSHWPNKTFRMLLERVIMKRPFASARAEYEKASPILRVGAEVPPMFLIHGDRDNLAPVDESRQFAAELRVKSAAPVVYAELPGAQHAFELFASIRSLHAIDGVARFCEYVHAAHCAIRATAQRED
jgi:acetyl esterase/lipase